MPSVLHVLPHPGGGGETYVDALAGIPGYRFERHYLAPTPAPREALASLPRTAVGAYLRARRHDLVHVHGEVAAAVCLPSLAMRPSIVTLHGLHFLRRAQGVAKWVARANLRMILKAASWTICVSHDERTDVLSLIGPNSSARLVVIHNGVASFHAPGREEREAARDALGLEASAVVGVWVGSLDERKDPLLAVSAALEVARSGLPLTLLLAGDGPLREDVERAVSVADPKAVSVLGFRSDVRLLLTAADFYVMTSSREGLAYSLLEAMAVGLPAVVLDAPGNVEAVGDAGLVVPRGNRTALADAFRTLVSDPPTRDALGRAAQERITREFQVDEMVERTRRLYASALSSA